MKTNERLWSPDALAETAQQLADKRARESLTITVCGGTGCRAKGTTKVLAALRSHLQENQLGRQVASRMTGCQGFCEQGPLVLIFPRGTCYVNVKPEDVPEVVTSALEGRVVERLLYRDTDTGRPIERQADIPFYKHQQRILLANNPQMSMETIDDYVALGGYQALGKALTTMGADDVLEEVKASGLRGRGGGGFPTGRKWETARLGGDPRFVVVNADEGDPGAYMDRSLLEGNPHAVLEGLVIGGYAIGAHHGFVYVRQEYPLAVNNFNKALDDARERGLLGDDILGSGFSFDVTVHRGAGAFVSGESSALISALQGHAGEPRLKYVRTAISGYQHSPTIINNVETWANIPFIVSRGAEWFRSIGCDGNNGTKIFSLVGKVKNTGLVEVPLGVTLRHIIFGIGGGVTGERFKAVQSGGPSGGCLPAEKLDLPVTFDSLDEAGSMMGSGGMIVMDETTCMVDVARYFMSFLVEESCGKCIPCREGLRNSLEILERICNGRGRPGDIELLEELGTLMRDASLCALGATAANPVLSTIRYFRDEYEAHIHEKRCPAKVCRALLTYFIDPEQCIGCGRCASVCPAGAIRGEKGVVHVIDQEKCINCGSCFDFCPEKVRAVQKLSGEPLPAAPDYPTPVRGRRTS